MRLHDTLAAHYCLTLLLYLCQPNLWSVWDHWAAAFLYDSAANLGKCSQEVVAPLMRPILKKQLCHFIPAGLVLFFGQGRASYNFCHTFKHSSLPLELSPTYEENDTWRLGLEVKILNTTNSRTARVQNCMFEDIL